MLRNWATTSDDFSASVIDLGVKGFSDGLAMDALGRLYFASFEEDAVKVFISPRFLFFFASVYNGLFLLQVFDTMTSEGIETARTLFTDRTSNVWVDTFAFDEPNKGHSLFPFHLIPHLHPPSPQVC